VLPPGLGLTSSKAGGRGAKRISLLLYLLDEGSSSAIKRLCYTIICFVHTLTGPLRQAG